VRYLDPRPRGGVALAARMKEVRYAKKYEWWSYEKLEERARDEAAEEANDPNELKSFGGQFETGVLNEQGWRYQGFIEDARGELRPQTFEETAYCVGCHGGVGRTEDGIFSFARKLDAKAFQGGWFHWSQRDLKDVGDRGEYSRYLELNGAGDESRQNAEVSQRFFDANGKLKPSAKKSWLTTPRRCWRRAPSAR
ncbi:MAG TPA: hypothetical protein VM686_24525, partial [Polyangiaceae bacterium]|nr:hypothetical protein [Polyangiaceae bacterium]